MIPKAGMIGGGGPRKITHAGDGATNDMLGTKVAAV
jgi:hypothetical protein